MGRRIRAAWSGQGSIGGAATATAARPRGTRGWATMIATALAPLLLALGCIGNIPSNPAATQPATAVDPATTQPSYWLGQPAAAQVEASNFDATWEACKSTARAYLYELDREDFRAGLITTRPLVSKQIYEFWRPDTGTGDAALQNTLTTVRRTLRFEIARAGESGFTITPKVLVERETIVERRVTSVMQYRTAFSGPRSQAKYAVTSDPESPEELPTKYWTPIGRDTTMERQVADRLRGQIARSAGGATLAQSGTAAPTIPATQAAPGARADGMGADGMVANVGGASGTVYINLGSADKVIPGMTFEVYESRAAIPAVEHYGRENPGSKGWIEVVSVAKSSSTCRIVKLLNPAGINKGDQVFNFIYEPRVQRRLAVAGDLAMASRETVTGLIWRWNGIVDERVTEQTSCLVLGKEPRDETGKQAWQTAKARATELKVPIIDEDRFNLLVRYYDPERK